MATDLIASTDELSQLLRRLAARDRQRLSHLGEHCANLVTALDLGDSGNFVTLRPRIRSALAADPTAIEINELVLDLLST